MKRRMAEPQQIQYAPEKGLFYGAAAEAGRQTENK